LSFFLTHNGHKQPPFFLFWLVLRLRQAKKEKMVGLFDVRHLFFNRL